MKKVIVIVLIMLLVGTGYFLLKDEVEKKVVEAASIVHPSENVISQFGHLTVNGYEWIKEDIHWIDETALLFYGRHLKEDAMTYNFNTNNLSLEKYENSLHEKDKTVVYESSKSTIYTENGTHYLNVYSNNENKLLSKTVNLNKDTPLSLSENEEKFAYTNADLDQISVWDIPSSKMKTIKIEHVYDNQKSLIDALTFSNDGGFLSVVSPKNQVSEMTFSIYGGDSASIYGKDIMGIAPIFSPDSKKLAFIYSGEMNEDYHHGKVGLFVIKYKKIMYLDTLFTSEKIFPKLCWSENSQSIYFLIETEEKTYRLMKSEVSNGKQVGIAFDLNQKIVQVNDMFTIDDKTYIVYNKEFLCVMDNDTGRYNFYEGLLPFENGSYLTLLKNKSLLIHLQGKLKLLGQNKESSLMTYDGEMVGVFISPEEERICLLSKDSNQMTLQVTNLKD